MREDNGAHAVGGDVRSFLIADTRGYTRYTVEHGDEAGAQLAVRFAAIAREIVEAHQGDVVELRGDEALAVFASARQALRGAVALQARLAHETVPGTGLLFKVGIGLDAGEAVPVEHGYRGGALNLAARLCNLAGPGEVLASEGIIHLTGKMDGLRFVDRGTAQLKGFIEPVRVVQVVPETVEGTGSNEGMSPQRPLPIGGFLGALPAGSLVARHDELHVVLSAADAVAGGNGRLLFLVGEPGIGKTRLAQEVALELRNRAFLVASGRCYEPQGAVPFYPFLEALEALYAMSPAATRSMIPQRWPYLGRLLPNQNLPTPSSSFDGTEEQERLFWSVTGFLQTVAEQMPVALLLDDLHWADGTSLALLQHLARQTRAYPVLVLGTYRDVEVGRQHPLERMLRDVHREGLVERIPLRRLGEDGTTALIATAFGQEHVPEAIATLIHQHTDGNPFFTHEVLRTLVERGDIYQEDGRWEGRKIEQIEVPESVRSTVGERLASLNESAQEILREASVLGQIFIFDELLAISGRSEGDMEEALEEATHAGLVRDVGHDTFGFDHALTQQAIYGELSSRRKRRLHLAAADVLEHLAEPRRTARMAELAWHLLEGDDPERALPYVIAAGDQAETVFAHAEAERHYHDALDLIAEGVTPAREAEVLEKLARVLRYTARYEEALLRLDRALTLAREAGDAEQEGRIVAELGLLHQRRGTLDEGLEVVGQTMQSLHDRLSPTTLVNLHEAQSYLLFSSGRYAEQLTSTEHQLAAARATGDTGIVAGALRRYGTALLTADQEGALAVLEQSIVLAEASGNLDALRAGLNDASGLHHIRGDFQKALDYMERCVAISERLGDLDELAFYLSSLAEVLMLPGSWDRAEVCLQRAASLPTAKTGWTRSYPLLGLGKLSVLRGDWDEAERYLAEAESVASANSDTQALTGVGSCLAEMLLLRGQGDAAETALQGLLEDDRERGLWRIELLALLAWAHVEQDDVVGATETVEEAMRLARAKEHQLAMVELLLIQGMSEAAAGRADEAERAFEEAIPLARSMPYPYAEARARYEWGRGLAAKGEGARGGEQLEEALHIFAGLGARPYLEWTQRALAMQR